MRADADHADQLADWRQVAILDHWNSLAPSVKNAKLDRVREREGVARPAMPTYPTSLDTIRAEEAARGTGCGTTRQYLRGCRCLACRDARRAYVQARRQTKVA